jgi:serine/threonine protein kinase
MTFSVRGYEVGELLGHGSRSEVFAAVSKRTGETVAIKRIGISTDQSMAGARAEAALLAALQHPNLIGFHEFIDADEHAILVLELAAGGSLANLLRRRDRLTPAEVGMCFSELAVALAHAHSHDILHGDISAGNVLYALNGRPKLADLGVARIVGDEMLSLGTPAYLDPVVAAGGATGPASDVFSLAAVALHAVTGAGPWTAAGNGADEILELAAGARIEGLEQRLAGCPAGMSAALMRALDPDPGRRGSAAELALDLRAALVAAPVTLAAGRLTPTPQNRPDSVAESSQSHRPDFDRPAGAMLPADLTHVSRPNVRNLLANTATEPPRRGRRTIVTAVVAVMVCLAAVRVGIERGSFGALGSRLFGSKSGRSTIASGPITTPAQPSVAASAPSPTKAVAPPTSSAPSSAASSRPSPAASSRPSPAVSEPSSPAEVTAILSMIDTRRAEAFRQRNIAQLSQVYSSAALQSQDAAQLLRAVPTGCGITNLITSYQRVVVTARPDGIDLTADVATSSATLMCAGKVSARVAATPARMMGLTLTGNAAAGYRIASQHEQVPS